MTPVLARIPTIAVLSGLIIGLTPLQVPAQSSSETPATRRETTPPDSAGANDFDFEIGTWKAQLSRLLEPLTGSTTWTEYEGTSVVRKLWDGRANLGELAIQGPTGHIEGLSLRLFNPQTRQWNIHWANSRDGQLGVAMVGGFKSGRGEFYNQETFGGRAIFVRFVFSDITATSFRLEQAFSQDGGKTWEANWIAKFTR